MKKNESITHIMSTTIVSANPSDKVSTVRKLMQDNGVHHLPVVSGQKIVGIISAVDVLKSSFSSAFAAEGKADEALDHIVALDDIMTTDVSTINKSDTIRHAAEILATSNYDSLLVVNDDAHLEGIVTSKDLISYLLEQY